MSPDRIWCSLCHTTTTAKVIEESFIKDSLMRGQIKVLEAPLVLLPFKYGLCVLRMLICLSFPGFQKETRKPSEQNQ